MLSVKDFELTNKSDRTIVDSVSRSTVSSLITTSRAQNGTRFIIMIWVAILVLLLLGGCDKSAKVTEGKTDGVVKSKTDAQNIPVPAQDISTKIDMARASMAAKDWQAAEDSLLSVLVADPNHALALRWLGDLALQKKQTAEAIRFYQAAMDSMPEYAAELGSRLAELWMAQGQPFEAVASLKAVIDRDPKQIQARYDLAGLASMLGVQEIVHEQLIWLLRHGQGDMESLVVLAQPNQVQPDGELCQLALKRCPTDLRANYGLAKLDAMALRWQEVVDRLRPVTKQYPNWALAHALYARALVELNDEKGLTTWLAEKPSDVDQSAQYWLAAGSWALQQRRANEAASAFSKAAALEQANNGETLGLLSAALREANESESSKIVGQRLALLSKLHDSTKTLYERDSRSQASALQVAKAMHELGRSWEAEAWARFSLTLLDDPVKDAKQQYALYRGTLTSETPWQTSFVLYADNLKNPLPEFAWKIGDGEETRKVAQNIHGTFAFKDESKARGLVHTTAIAPQADSEGHWIFQSNGGGAAAIDIDLDGWCDVALANLDGLPIQENSRTDVVFRNQNGQFVEITSSIGIQDLGFTQGITVGDYNSDGFSDLFICNIGQSKLYRNQGDGTFIDVTESVGLQGKHWTTSAVLTDLDLDGIADIHLVNYCGGSRPFEHACRNRTTGKMSSCTPVDFDAEADRVFKGQEDGTFIDASEAWDLRDEDGRGLGLVVGFMDERPGIDVFVANDMTANYLWSPSGDRNRFEWTELGTARGVALSGQSLSQASMGIAVGDADQDLDLDLFLTHFYDEHNTYYEQRSPGVWSDRSFASGLGQPSMSKLGFGTQFVDIDNNGQLELVITNGHVSNLEDRGIPYRMPGQVFYSDGDFNWSESNASTLGDYFQSAHLGRALIVLDANRDGRQDVLITHLYEPISLLMNATRVDGTERPENSLSLGLNLQAVRSHRDAIGTVVKVESAGKTLYSQLTGGDGYLCSNQRRVSFGLASEPMADRVIIQWPSGNEQVFEDLEAGSDYLVVEGEAPLWMYHH